MRALIERIIERSPDDFYEKAYEGWYCVGCESFKQDAEIIDGKCVLHPTRTLEWVEERNWFFRLSRYTEFLRALLTDRPEFLQPESRRNEMLALLKQGLRASQPAGHAIHLGRPSLRHCRPGAADFDVCGSTPPNLHSATAPGPGWRERWPRSCVVGKDITRFHSIIWPKAILQAAAPLRSGCGARVHVLLGGERFSGSTAL